MRTFLRRWIIINSIYHFHRGINYDWVVKDDFVDWVLGYGLNINTPKWWYENIPPKPSCFRRYFLYKLLNPSKQNRYECSKDIKDIIDECFNQEKKYLKERSNAGKKELRLDVFGLDIYPVSYLIFGHYYAKKFWTIVGFGLLAWWISTLISGINIQF